ncbi:hypothetical protein [Nocardioides pocheonensis]|uniref:Uncharacterized protein n=1 Tax=Nocardioides pocheonensis TaxID=661485 RepID=A0A3N0GZA2_9ACTN|nr:hypothetical protein [Nocardioides pocheonensis]RNM17480.1 hypothetical protein EFL26_01460 [Nocardioides pocheonensis]
MAIAWPILVALALFGWGLVASAAAKRWSGVDLDAAADALPLGIATYLAIAGGALALDVHTRWFTTAMVLAGLAATAVTLVRRARLGSLRLSPRTVVAAALIGLLLAIALWRAARFLWNPCDDDPAYLYLVRRMTESGNLLDPSNLRRATSLGGMSSLQAMFLGNMDDSALPLADLFLGPLLVLVQLWRTSAGGWSRLGIVGAVGIALLPASLGVKNTSPAILAIGFALAAYRLALRTRTYCERHEGAGGVEYLETTGSRPRIPVVVHGNQPAARARLVLGAATGLVVAAAGTMRPQFALALFPFAILAALLPLAPRPSVYSVTGLALGGAVVLTGWMVASWRAVGTPMFPLLGGNVDPAWPVRPDVAGPTVTDVLGNVLDVLTSQIGLALLLGGAALVGVRWTGTSGLSGRSIQWAARIYVLAVAANVLVLAVLGTLWWGAGTLFTFQRFWMPIAVATALFPLAVLNQGSFFGMRAALMKGVAFAAAAAVTVGPGAWHVDLSDLVSSTASGQTLRALATDRHERVDADYNEVSRMIEPGSKGPGVC